MDPWAYLEAFLLVLGAHCILKKLLDTVYSLSTETVCRTSCLLVGPPLFLCLLYRARENIGCPVPTSPLAMAVAAGASLLHSRALPPLLRRRV